MKCLAEILFIQCAIQRQPLPLTCSLQWLYVLGCQLLCCVFWLKISNVLSPCYFAAAQQIVVWDCAAEDELAILPFLVGFIFVHVFCMHLLLASYMQKCRSSVILVIFFFCFDILLPFFRLASDLIPWLSLVMC